MIPALSADCGWSRHVTPRRHGGARSFSGSSKGARVQRIPRHHHSKTISGRPPGAAVGDPGALPLASADPPGSLGVLRCSTGLHGANQTGLVSSFTVRPVGFPCGGGSLDAGAQGVEQAGENGNYRWSGGTLVARAPPQRRQPDSAEGGAVRTCTLWTTTGASMDAQGCGHHQRPKWTPETWTTSRRRAGGPQASVAASGLRAAFLRRTPNHAAAGLRLIEHGALDLATPVRR